jgi:hypothetical protein
MNSQAPNAPTVSTTTARRAVAAAAAVAATALLALAASPAQASAAAPAPVVAASKAATIAQHAPARPRCPGRWRLRAGRGGFVCVRGAARRPPRCAAGHRPVRAGRFYDCRQVTPAPSPAPTPAPAPAPTPAPAPAPAPAPLPSSPYKYGQWCNPTVTDYARYGLVCVQAYTYPVSIGSPPVTVQMPGYMLLWIR